MKQEKVSTFYLIFHHLGIRLIIVFFLCAIPVIALSILTILRVSKIYESRMIEAYQNEINTYCAGFNAKIDYINTAISEYLSPSTVYMLTNGAQGSNEVAITSIGDDLYTMRTAMGIPALSFVRDNETGLLGISKRPYNYSYSQIRDIQSALEADTTPSHAAIAYTFLTTSTDSFLYRRYDFSHFSIGFLIDAKNLLDGAYAMRDSDLDQFYLLDSASNLQLHKCANSIASPLEEIDSSIKDSFGADNTSIIVSSAIGTTGFSLLWVIPRRSMLNSVYSNIKYFWLLFISALVAWPVLWIAVNYYIIHPMRTLVKAFSWVEHGDLEHQLPEEKSSFQMQYIFLMFNRMIQQIKILKIESYEREIEKLQTDLINLKLQVRPHMLLNSLNTIYNLAQSNENQKILDFSMQLIRYLRYILRSDDTLVTVQEELKFVQNYLAMQRIRFPNSFNYICQTAQEATNVFIPPFIIENFVENTIKYGLTLGNCIKISVSVQISVDKLIIEVDDTGCGIEQTILEKLQRGEKIEDKLGNHIGIWNCRQRLDLYYAGNAFFQIESKINEGTHISMKLPLTPSNLKNNDSAIPI